MRRRTYILSLLLVPLLTGCTTYEYNLVKPERFAGHIARKQETVVALDPLEYHFIAYDNHLVVRIKNPTDEPITLLGDRSSAIDPKGESHPLRSQTIAPGTFIKLILPPPRPQVYDPGPRIGFGFGIIGRAGAGSPFYGGSLSDEPRYYTVYDDADNSRWEWNGESSARLVLTFQRAGKSFTDEFTFYQKKV